MNQRPFRQKLATRQPAKIFDFRAVNFFFQPQPQIISKSFQYWQKDECYVICWTTNQHNFFFRFHDFFSTFCIVAKKVKLGHRTKVFCANRMEQRKRPFGIWEVTVEFISFRNGLNYTYFCLTICFKIQVITDNMCTILEEMGSFLKSYPGGGEWLH